MDYELFLAADQIGISGRTAILTPGLDVLVASLDNLVPGAAAYIRGFNNIEGWRSTSVKFFDDHSTFLWISLLGYPPIIFGLSWLMKYSEPFDLRVPLIIWNIFLALFSLLGAVYMVPLAPWALNEYGWWTSVCSRWCYGIGENAFLVFLFNLSKVFEFVDTLFIVLRKKPLIFLHYYHHVATMAFCWFCNQTSQDVGCHGFYFSTMNFFVHFVMYSYYAAIAMRIRIPVIISTFITTMQIVQMIIGVAVVYTLSTCYQVDKITVYFGSALYLSFFLLFADFFYKRYFTKRPAPPSKSPPHQTTAPKSPKEKSQ